MLHLLKSSSAVVKFTRHRALVPVDVNVGTIMLCMPANNNHAEGFFPFLPVDTHIEREASLVTVRCDISASVDAMKSALREEGKRLIGVPLTQAIQLPNVSLNWSIGFDDALLTPEVAYLNFDDVRYTVNIQQKQRLENVG